MPDYHNTSDKEHFEKLLEEASEWLVKLSNENSTLQQRQDFEYWVQQSPQHQAAVQRIQSMINRLEQLKQSQDKTASRHIIQNALQDQPKFKFQPHLPFMFTILSILMGIIVYHVLPIYHWMADEKNSYQEWHETTLNDGSGIKISGHSAYNIRFDKQLRIVELLNGNIMVNVAKDTQRPFIVKTEYASIKALGTRFMIHQSSEQTILTMLESRVEVKTSTQTLMVVAGQQVVINKTGDISTKEISSALIESAWKHHSLAIEEMPLNQVLDILESYHLGQVWYQKDAIDHFKVTAVLPLDDQQKAFNLLQDSLPIQVNQPLPYVTIVSQK